MPRKLIEQSRLKADVDPERLTFITLADGQEWGFPRPILEIHPIFSGGKTVDYTTHITMGPELDVLIQAIAAGEMDAVSQIQSVMLCGALLLKRNYDITDEELPRLFSYRAGDPASEEMIANIIAVATDKPMLDRINVEE